MERLGVYPSGCLTNQTHKRIIGDNNMQTAMKPIAEDYLLSKAGELRYLNDSMELENPGETSIPLNLKALPQFLQDYVELAQNETDAIPGALITALLPYIAVNIGNKVSIRGNASKQYCSIWAVLAGPSSVSRKSTCLRLAASVLQKLNTEVSGIISPHQREKRQLEINSVTDAKLFSLLSKNPNRLLVFDEFSSFLKSTNQSYNSSMKANMTSLYNGDSRTIANMERTDYIESPALSILGASTYGWIYESFESAVEQESGFLQRFIFCVIGKDNKSFCSKQGESRSIRAELEAYDEILKVFRQIPESCELKMTDKAKKIWLDEHDRILNKLLRADDEALMAYATRIYNNVFLSLSIIFTLMKKYRELESAIRENRCKEFFEELYVSEETVTEALSLCHYYLENAKPMLTIICEGGSQRKERKIVRHLLNVDDYADTHSNIMKKFRFSAQEMKNCILNLYEQGLIDIHEQASENTAKRCRIYSLANND
jgi:hypothetical protein